MTDAGVLEGVQLWDGEAHRGMVTIRWSGGGIDTIEPAAENGPTSDLCVIPGLIDTHVHLIGNASDQPADFLGWPLVTRPEEQVLHGLAHAQRALRGGVTTLRDLSADEVQFSLVRALRAGIVDGPRVLAHGLVGMTGGHGDLFIPPAVAQRKPVADGPDACRALVRHWARAGADGIKITTSGGVLSVGDKAAWRNYTRDEIAAIVDEAHALGMRVAAHAHTAAGIEVAIDESVDSIEHATLVEPAQAARIAERGISVAPTLLINDRIAAGRMANAEQAAKAGDLVVERDARFRAAAEAGVDFVLGTDANGAHVEFGEQMTEVRRMAEIFGWTAERALQAATSRAARAIGLEGVTGVVRPGAAADLVVLRGRPWERIGDLDVANIVDVVAGGRRVGSTRG
jgi:imidazolonepropionase-like amidohydrolase